MFGYYLKQHIFFIVSIALYSFLAFLIFMEGALDGWYVVFSFLILSFFLSMFIKENRLSSYLKIVTIYALLYGLILSIEFGVYVYVTDSGFRENFIDLDLRFLFNFGLLILFINVIPVFLGGILGIVPKGIIERLMKASKQ